MLKKIIEKIKERVSLDLVSDIHLREDNCAYIRVKGEITKIEDLIISKSYFDNILSELLTISEMKKLNLSKEYDLAYEIKGLARFRINIYYSKAKPAIAIRIIPDVISSFDDLGLPIILNSIKEKNFGLNLISGPAGSGKSTTLASIIEDINSNKAKHIITIEDPIEYQFNEKKSLIEQREIGTCAINFSSALRSSLRQDPDVIAVGEMRDKGTIKIALSVAETGHQIISTMHTIGAIKTIERIISNYSGDEQDHIRNQLADVIDMIISQKLIKSSIDEKIYPAFEILVATPAIRNLIRENKTYQINSIIQTCSSLSMISMDDCLIELYKKSKLSKEDIIKNSINKEYIQNILN